MPGGIYSFASAKTFSTVTPRASAIRNRFNAVTFLSPRSILPMWDRSIPAWCANCSCEMPNTSRALRMARPNAFNLRRSSSVLGLLDTVGTFPSDTLTGHGLYDPYFA